MARQTSSKGNTTKASRRAPAAPTPTLPVVSDQAVLQNDSRPILEQALRPWLVTHWTTHDYGTDAVVEVLQSRGSTGGYFNTGKRIAMQLKACGDIARPTEGTVPVNVRTVKYWLASNEPFAIVFCHVPTGSLAYRWIDDDLVAALGARDPSWFTKETVTIRIPWAQGLSPERLADIDREARLLVVRRHRVLAPGTYERLQTESREAMSEVLSAATAGGFDSVIARLAEAERTVRDATYVVALAGRMRAGKSTLFNALVRRELSPVAKRPTTAVPVLVTAGASETATVAFQNGSVQTIPVAAGSIAEFATQDANPGNTKGVRTVVVRLVSERLERGIAILDAPGLFDPSPDIQAITARAIAGAHAVLFVMDVSSARTGGFAVESHVLDELKRVLDHSERVFLLLNKADELEPSDRDDVLATLRSALARDRLQDRFAASPAFISAKQAWLWAAGGAEGRSPIAGVEDQVWDYLLRTNATGVARLETAVRAASKAVADSQEFLRMRRASAEQARLVRQRLATATKAIAGLREECDEARTGAYWRAVARLDAELKGIPGVMGAEMRKAGSIPTPAALSARLNALATAALRGSWDVAFREMEVHALDVSDALEVALDQVRLNHAPVMAPSVQMPSFSLPAANLVAGEAFGFGAVGGVLGALVNPGAALLVALGSFIFGAWVGKEKKLESEIVKIEARIRGHIKQEVVKQAKAVLDTILGGYDRLNRHVEDRWAVFENDVRGQLEAAGQPLSLADGARLERLDRDLIGSARRLEALAEEIRWSPGPQPTPKRG